MKVNDTFLVNVEKIEGMFVWRIKSKSFDEKIYELVLGVRLQVGARYVTLWSALLIFDLDGWWFSFWVEFLYCACCYLKTIHHHMLLLISWTLNSYIITKSAHVFIYVYIACCIPASICWFLPLPLPSFSFTPLFLFHTKDSICVLGVKTHTALSNLK